MFMHFIASKMMHRTKKSKLKRIEIGLSEIAPEGSTTPGVLSGYFYAEEGQTFMTLAENETAVTLYGQPEGAEEAEETTGFFGYNHQVSSNPDIIYGGISIHVVASAGSLPFSVYSDSTRTQAVEPSDLVNASTTYYLNIDPSKIITSN